MSVYLVNLPRRFAHICVLLLLRISERITIAFSREL
jgi:hypothetical protein